jgi:hypothetical protein
VAEQVQHGRARRTRRQGEGLNKIDMSSPFEGWVLINKLSSLGDQSNVVSVPAILATGNRSVPSRFTISIDLNPVLALKNDQTNQFWVADHAPLMREREFSGKFDAARTY